MNTTMDQLDEDPSYQSLPHPHRELYDLLQRLKGNNVSFHMLSSEEQRDLQIKVLTFITEVVPKFIRTIVDDLQYSWLAHLISMHKLVFCTSMGFLNETEMITYQQWTEPLRTLFRDGFALIRQQSSSVLMSNVLHVVEFQYMDNVLHPNETIQSRLQEHPFPHQFDPPQPLIRRSPRHLKPVDYKRFL